jgi:membrane fusion protein (multidrug efflux system)
MLLPQQAVTRSNQGDTVLVVGADGVPAKRQIKLGASQNNQWIVLSGLQAGEQVIVEGFQKMMVPGAPVKPCPGSGGKPPAAPRRAACLGGAWRPASAAAQR